METYLFIKGGKEMDGKLKISIYSHEDEYIDFICDASKATIVEAQQHMKNDEFY